MGREGGRAIKRPAVLGEASLSEKKYQTTLSYYLEPLSLSPSHGTK
jgi:hypothetical protein